MLSRIAESLYWMGRYVERADDTARLLDVHVHRMLADAADERVGATLLAAMGLAGSAEVADVDLWRATELLAYDQDNPSSVAGSLRLARENARGLRETLATEVWEAINRTHHDLDAQVRAARALGPNLFFRWVGERVALLGGLIDSVVLHDDGWRFLTAGRCLERVDMTARLLAAVTTDDDASRWSSVLESCGANDAFLRTTAGRSPASGPWPSSSSPRTCPARWSSPWAGPRRCLREIAVANGTPGTSVRVVGRARAELTYASAADLVARADEVVGRAPAACREVDDLVRGRYFRRADLIEWSSEHPGGGGVTIRMALTHTTSYRYGSPASASYNEARLEPRSDRRQTVLSWDLDVSPSARIGHHVDYWGTMVHHFDIQGPHSELTVVGRAVVEAGMVEVGPGEATWDDLVSDEVRDRFYELLVPTGVVDMDHEEVEAAAAEIRSRSATPAEAAEAVVGWVHDTHVFEQGFTGITTTASEVLTARRGVCQDFAHALPRPAAGHGHPGLVRVGVPPPAGASPRSTRRSWGRATPGWRPGRARCGPSTPPAWCRCTSATSGWRRGATTTTWRRSGASTRAPVWVTPWT